MCDISATLTVYFECPFWVGTYECISGGKLSAVKMVFGAEPKDYEVYEYLNAHWKSWVFSPALAYRKSPRYKVNPKRRHKLINRQLQEKGTGTKAQEALRLQQEEKKIIRKI